MLRPHQRLDTKALKQLLYQAQKTDLGFTLIEVIIVVGILLILAAIGIPAYTGYMEAAKSAKTEYSSKAAGNASAANSALSAATAP